MWPAYTQRGLHIWASSGSTFVSQTQQIHKLTWVYPVRICHKVSFYLECLKWLWGQPAGWWTYLITCAQYVNWLCWGLTTHQSLWVILCRLLEKGRKEIEEVLEMKGGGEGRGVTKATGHLRLTQPSWWHNCFVYGSKVGIIILLTTK